MSHIEVAKKMETPPSYELNVKCIDDPCLCSLVSESA